MWTVYILLKSHVGPFGRQLHKEIVILNIPTLQKLENKCPPKKKKKILATALFLFINIDLNKV